jgi:hypothetical protein
MKRIDLNEHEGDDNIIKFPSLKKSQPPPSSPGEKFSATWAGIDLQSSEGKQSFKDGDPEFFTGSGKRPLKKKEKGILRNAEKVIEMVQDQNYTNAKHVIDNDLAMNAEWMVKAIRELEQIRRGGGPRSKFVKQNPWLMDM